MNIKEIQEIKSQIEQRKQQIERAKGRKEQLLETLKREFDCNTLEEAKKLLEKAKNDGKETREKIDRLAERIEKIWNESQGESENEF